MNRPLKAKIALNFETSENFAIAAKENRATVSLVLHGKKQISNGKKARWAMLLDCEVSDIFPE